MKTFPRFCIAGLVGVVSTGAAMASTLVNFDASGITAFTDVTTQYAAQGVTFSGVTDAGSSVNIEAADNSVFGDVNAFSSPNVLSDFYGGNAGNRAHIMEINFTTPASGISFEYNPAGSLGSGTVFDVYNAAHVLVNSFSDPSAIGDGVWYLESVPNVNVSEVDIVNPTPGWGHYIDDLRFTSSVPDGGMTLGLLGSALTALACLRRKLA
jgi:hypothetical protein